MQLAMLPLAVAPAQQRTAGGLGCLSEATHLSDPAPVLLQQLNRPRQVLHLKPYFSQSETWSQADDRLCPSRLNIHRLLLTGAMLAAKLMDDHYYNNAYYAKVPFDFRPTFCNTSDVCAPLDATPTPPVWDPQSPFPPASNSTALQSRSTLEVRCTASPASSC